MSDPYAALPPPVADLARRADARVRSTVTLWLGIPALGALALSIYVLCYTLSMHRDMRPEELLPIAGGALFFVIAVAIIVWMRRRPNKLLALADTSTQVTRIYIRETRTTTQAWYNLVIDRGAGAESLEILLTGLIEGDDEIARSRAAKRLQATIAACYPKARKGL
jgi:hypothetical protein